MSDPEDLFDPSDHQPPSGDQPGTAKENRVTKEDWLHDILAALTRGEIALVERRMEDLQDHLHDGLNTLRTGQEILEGTIPIPKGIKAVFEIGMQISRIQEILRMYVQIRTLTERAHAQLLPLLRLQNEDVDPSLPKGYPALCHQFDLLRRVAARILKMQFPVDEDDPTRGGEWNHYAI
jgi:hypothetical protein